MWTSPRLPAALTRACVLTATVLVSTPLLVAAPLAVAGPAAAQSTEVVGGPRLAGTGVVVGSGEPAVPAVAATSWLVADLDSGHVLAAKDAHGRYAPASTLKTLTALTLIPELPADRVVTASFDDVDVEGSRVGIVERVDYPVSELFSALLMVSGNDAANVLASAAGGQERTAELMNARAASLRAYDTHAVNPHGLDAEGQTSSAYDLALIARAGLADPDFARYVSTLNSSVNAPGGARIAMSNKNKLLKSYPGALGVKNGYTSRARASFVGAAEREGRRLVVTLMKADPRVFDEAVKLLDWGFSSSGTAPVGVLVDPLEPLPPAEVDGSTQAVTGIAGTSGGPSAAASSREDAAAAALAPSLDDAAGSGTGLPVTLAGLMLAAAAVLAVRVRPAPAHRPSSRRPAAPPGARAAVSSTPSRPTPTRVAPRTSSARTAAPSTRTDSPSGLPRPVSPRPVPRRPLSDESAPRR